MSERIDRRQLGKIAIKGGLMLVAGDSLISHLPHAGVGISRSFWETVESEIPLAPIEKLIAQLRDEYRVDVLSPDPESQQFVDGVLASVKDNPKSLVPWDSLRLTAVIQTLSQLPSNFYSPRKRTLLDEQASPLKIALTQTTLSDFLAVRVARVGSACICGPISTTPLVIFEKSSLGQTALEKSAAKSTITHELGHYVTSENIFHYIDEICYPIGIKNQSDLEKVFSAEFNVAKLFRLITTELSYGTTNFNEFFSVACQCFILGKKTFIEIYAPFLGSEKAELLYSGMKKVIFQDHEY